MKVLIVKKKSGLDLFGDRVEEQVALGVFPASDLAKLRTAHEEHQQTLCSLYDELSKAKIDYQEVSKETIWPFTESSKQALMQGPIHMERANREFAMLPEWATPANREHFAAILCVGGDGTILSAGQHIKDSIPLVGIKSSSTSVGFLCAYNKQNLPSCIDRLRNDRLKCTQVERLSAEVTFVRDVATYTTPPVLNDFLFTNLNPAAVTQYRLVIGHLSEEQRSSGIWMATPAGSTAAIAAAGGKRCTLDSKTFQYTVRERYVTSQETSTFNAGFFNPEKERFEIEIRCKSAILALDGQHGYVRLSYGDRIVLKRSSPVQLATKV